MMAKSLLSLVIVLALSAGAHACATCAGGDNLQLIEASNSVLWTLLGLVGFIFVATASTVYFLWRRANTAARDAQSIHTLNHADAAN